MSQEERNPNKVRKVFERGSAVEVSIDGSWYSGTICNRRDSDRFKVQYRKLAKTIGTTVSVHQLRPAPPPPPKFWCGDKVEAFRDSRWWEGRVTEYLGHGRFLVCFWDSEKMAFPKRLLREWINYTGRDRISELPDALLLYMINNFMDTRDAVQTSVLSKRWKPLCKRLSNITLVKEDDYKMNAIGLFNRRSVADFKKFASWVLSGRDDSYSLLNLTICCSTDPELLDSLITYALFCNVQHLKLQTNRLRPDCESLSSIFSSQSLTSLDLRIGWYPPTIVLPYPLHLPAIESLHLQFIKFPATDDNHSAEPFSNCPLLNTLDLSVCSLHNDAQVLHISNSTLTSLTVFGLETYPIVLSTPNLSSFTIGGSFGHHFSSTCKLSFLGQVNIEVAYADSVEKSTSITRWLQALANNVKLFANVKILTFSSMTIRVIHDELSNPTSMRAQPPSFVRLESLKVIKEYEICNEKVNTVLEYLLQNSPKARVDIINNIHT